MTRHVFIARQPIVDANGDTFGYELLYRSGNEGGSRFDDPNQATQAVIERTYLDWGMERLIGEGFGLINADASLICRGLHRALPPEGVIIELQEHTPFDDATIAAIEFARREGYHFALDNVASLEEIENSRALPYCSLVKIDMLATASAVVPQIVRRAKQLCGGLLVAGEKIETNDQHMVGIAAGFDLFQGYLFARPEVLVKVAHPATSSGVLALWATTQRDDVSIDRLEATVGSDPTLAFRVLSVVNASAFGIDRHVDSVRHALELLGVAQVRHLALLLSLSQTQDVDPALIARAVVRARLMSELVGDPSRAPAAHAVGLLSVCAAIFDSSMSELIAELPVDDSIGLALAGADCEMAPLLEVATACERGDLDRVEQLMPGAGDRVRAAYTAALEFAGATELDLSPVSATA